MTNDKIETSAEVLSDDDIDGVQGGATSIKQKHGSTSSSDGADQVSALALPGSSTSDDDAAAAALALFELNAILAKLRT